MNLNTCYFKDLRAIGCSPNIAASILHARPFQTVDDLSRVAGISKSHFNILREKVTVGDGM
ncbi:MAG: helix-hairpin-helix domain-containing protein [Bacteroidaceae bacterium]|nr:helix-hairpin-helix domain-containing protein [Bacteroidaceae bacterium]